MIRKKLIGIKYWGRDTIRFFTSLPSKDAKIIFANSFPKSGTNLFTQLLRGFARSSLFRLDKRGAILTYDGTIGQKRDEEKILNDLEGLYPGEIGWGHIHATAQITKYLLNPRFIHFFVYRDLRDVVVSHAYYVSDPNQGHANYDYYQNKLHTMDERIAASILGIADSALDFPDIGKRFAPYLPWLKDPQVKKVKFEDLIHNQDQTLLEILTHIEMMGYPLPDSIDKTLKMMKEAINPKTSRTFRQGKTGDWKNHFSEAHKDIFKEVAGDMLIELGFEDDLRW